jgi:hypothetical protein
MSGTGAKSECGARAEPVGSRQEVGWNVVDRGGTPAAPVHLRALGPGEADLRDGSTWVSNAPQASARAGNSELKLQVSGAAGYFRRHRCPFMSGFETWMSATEHLPRFSRALRLLNVHSIGSGLGYE